MSDVEPTIATKSVEDMLVASVKYRGDYEEADVYFEALIRQVRGQLCGPVFCLYTDRLSEAGMDIECCAPVKRAVQTGEIKSRVLPGATILSVTHRGPYRTLGESWGALFDYVERHNLRVKGPRREIYLDTEPVDSEQHVTELQVPLAK